MVCVFRFKEKKELMFNLKRNIRFMRCPNIKMGDKYDCYNRVFYDLWTSDILSAFMTSTIVSSFIDISRLKRNKKNEKFIEKL